MILLSNERHVCWLGGGATVSGAPGDSPWEVFAGATRSATREDYNAVRYDVDGTEITEPSELEEYPKLRGPANETCE